MNKITPLNNQKSEFSDNISNRPIRGRVQIFKDTFNEYNKKESVLIRDSSNLIVYRGRHWLIQKAFNKHFETERIKDLYVSWFAIGTGGALAGSPLTPTAPSLTDTTLSSHGILGANSTKIITFSGKQYHAFDGSGSVPDYPVYEEDPEIIGVGNDGYLVAKIRVTLSKSEGNGSLTDDDGSGGSGGSGVSTSWQDINEAGLFFSDSNVSSPAPSKMDMFARFTFSTIRKTSSFGLTFNWYIFF